MLWAQLVPIYGDLSSDTVFQMSGLFSYQPSWLSTFRLCTWRLGMRGRDDLSSGL